MKIRYILFLFILTVLLSANLFAQQNISWSLALVKDNQSIPFSKPVEMKNGDTYKELTILFSDISGFTKWSSDKSPEDVHDFLSDYLESMAEIIFSYGGTVDKFMGDGILAFFGDPIDMPDHSERSIRWNSGDIGSKRKSRG